ncbi:MAG: hypothetical protein ILP18_00260, partial [Treponema sp.]|nr:hypothetical protein [Treponema sp.]
PRQGYTAGEFASPVRVAFACDEQYVPLLRTALSSVAVSSCPSNNYEIIIISDGITDVSRQQLRSELAGRENMRLRFVELPEKLGGLEVSLCNGLSTVSYARLFLPYILQDYKKIVYLDCDVEVKTDLCGLYATDVGGVLLAAVEDPYIKIVKGLKDYRAEAVYLTGVLSLPLEYRYFNSGVLVLNLEEFRSRYRMEDVISRICSDDFLWGDQDVLNMLCADRVLYLPQAWNHMESSEKEVQRLMEKDAAYLSEPCIVHYAGRNHMKKCGRAKTFRFPNSKASCCSVIGRFSFMRIPTPDMFTGAVRKFWAHLAMLLYAPLAQEQSERNSVLLNSLRDLAVRKAGMCSKLRQAKERLAELETLLAKNACLLFLLVFLRPLPSFCQEAVKSVEEEYYSFLALSGEAVPPCLNYRTLSDSVWSAVGGGIWNEGNLGLPKVVSAPSSPAGNFLTRGIKRGLSFKLYGPELFTSWNSAAPHGQNDAALWQGRGCNASLTAGVRMEAWGLELTAKPVVTFSQNLAFSYTSPNYDYVHDQQEVGDLYEDKASVYGYYGRSYVDAPQRFGEKAFFSFSPGDSEIRYSWHSMTLGFGWQSPWLGPAKLNPLLHSNNAAPYPKFDIGLRKTH